MNVATLVGNALRSMPAGIAARVTVTRTVPGTVNRATDARAGDATLVMDKGRDGAPGLPCFVVPVKADRSLPPGLKREHAREVIIAGAELTTFIPASDDKLQIGASTTTVLEATPFDLGDKSAPIAIALLVQW